MVHLEGVDGHFRAVFAERGGKTGTHGAFPYGDVVNYLVDLQAFSGNLSSDFHRSVLVNDVSDSDVGGDFSEAAVNGTAYRKPVQRSSHASGERGHLAFT